MSKDYYELLGVARDASSDDIRKAYRKLAMQYHPDRNSEPDAEERFKEVTEAWEVLSTPDKRELYDRYGEAGVRRGGAGESPFGGFANFTDPLEVFMREFGAGGFGDLFGGGQRGANSRTGSSLKISLTLTLEEAARGAERVVRVSVMSPCERCNAGGAEPGSSTVTCENCQGVGEVRVVQRSMLGQFVSVSPCRPCGGEGTRIENKCRECSGSGRIKTDKMVDLEIPAGISAEDYLKLRGRGNVGPRGGEPGDLIVRIEIEPHDQFDRNGDDLLIDLPITFSQAALGVELEVPTILSEARITIPAGIQAGQILRLRGQGMPKLRANGRGDQLVRVRVWTPTDVGPEQLSALKDLAAVEQDPPEPGRGDDPTFWERVKAAFTA